MPHCPTYQISSQYSIPMTIKRHMRSTDWSLCWEHMVDIWANLHPGYLMHIIRTLLGRNFVLIGLPQAEKFDLIWQYYRRGLCLFLGLLLHALITPGLPCSKNSMLYGTISRKEGPHSHTLLCVISGNHNTHSIRRQTRLRILVTDEKSKVLGAVVRPTRTLSIAKTIVVWQRAPKLAI